MDEIAELIAGTLTQAQPGESKAKYSLDAAVAADTRKRAADLLAPHPLYPTITL